MTKFETRAVSGVVVDDGSVAPQVRASAIVFDRWSQDLGGFVERMMPGSVTLEADMLALFDHQTQYVIGRQSAGTMSVLRHAAGVDFTAVPPDTQWARDMLVSLKRGDIKGCSYRMQVSDDRWYVRDDGVVARDVLAASVCELTITSMPAYPQTTAAVRSRAAAFVRSELRAGRTLSAANEQALKDALAALDIAENAIEGVLSQVDPAFEPEDEATESGDSAAEEGAEGGASSDSGQRSTGGAPGETYRYRAARALALTHERG